MEISITLNGGAATEREITPSASNAGMLRRDFVIEFVGGEEIAVKARIGAMRYQEFTMDLKLEDVLRFSTTHIGLPTHPLPYPRIWQRVWNYQQGGLWECSMSMEPATLDTPSGVRSTRKTGMLEVECYWDPALAPPLGSTRPSTLDESLRDDNVRPAFFTHSLTPSNPAAGNPTHRFALQGERRLKHSHELAAYESMGRNRPGGPPKAVFAFHFRQRGSVLADASSDNNRQGYSNRPAPHTFTLPMR